jgi:hypothetical protein
MPTCSRLKRLSVAVLVTLTSLLSGCASFLEEDTQEVNVRFMCAEKHIVATCNLKNDKGQWRLSTPGKATIINDASVLDITCRAPLIPSFSVSVLPIPSMGMVGNVFFGGVVGAAVDLYNNTGLKYPKDIAISNPNCK